MYKSLAEHEENEVFEGRTENEHGNIIFPVAMRLGDTPVLIPNTMVKT